MKMWFAWFLKFSCNIHQFIPLGKSLSLVKIKSKCDTEKQNPTYLKSLHIYPLLLILILDLILNAIKSFKHPQLKCYFFPKAHINRKKKYRGNGLYWKCNWNKAALMKHLWELCGYKLIHGIKLQNRVTCYKQSCF